MKRLNVYFSDKEKNELAKASKEREQSQNDIVREAVRQWLDNYRKG